LRLLYIVDVIANYTVPFCLPKKVPKKGPRNRYTARLREGAVIKLQYYCSFSSGSLKRTP